METFTRQELIYIARALRVEAGVNDDKAKDPKYGTAQHNFSSAAEALRKLAEKAERIGKLMRP